MPRLLYATLLDVLGFILLVVGMILLPRSLNNQLLYLLLFAIPFFFYFLSWKYFKEEFWKAFVVSLVVIAVVVLGGFKLLLTLL